MIRQLSIAAVVFGLLACTLSGCGGGGGGAATVPDAPEVEPVPAQTSATVSKLDMPAPMVQQMNDALKKNPQMATMQMSKVEMTISGIGQDSDCKKAMDAAAAAPQNPASGQEVMTKCMDALSSVSKVWVETTFAAGSLVSKETAVVDIDGSKLAAIAKNPSEAGAAVKKMSQSVQTGGVDLQGLNKITAWASMSEAFITKVVGSCELNAGAIKSLVPSAGMRQIAENSVSRPMHLARALFLPYVPSSTASNNIVAKSVVARRLGEDFSQPDAPSDACSLAAPETAIADMNKDEKKSVKITGVTLKVEGVPADCCTKIQETLKIAEPTAAQGAAVKECVLAATKDIAGVWATITTTPNDKAPIKSISGYTTVDGAALNTWKDEAYMKDVDPIRAAKLKAQMAGQLLAGFQRFYASFSYAKIQAHFAATNFLVKAMGWAIELDEAKVKAMIAKEEQEAEATDVFDQLEENVMHIIPQLAPHVANIVQLSSSTSTPVDSASPLTLGAVSLGGSLVLMGVVAAAFIVRKRWQVRDIQESHATTEMTSHEVA